MLELKTQTKLRRAIYQWGQERGDGYPMRRFARAVGINQGRISEYQNGKQIPPRHMLMICEELQCDPLDVIGMDE